MAQKPRVIVTRRLPGLVESRMREIFDVQLNPTDTPMDSEALSCAMQEADVLAPTVTDRIDGTLIRQAGQRLRLIASFGAGVDHIDVEEAHQRGIIVTNTPDVLTRDTADMTMALMLAVPRRLVEGAQLLRGSEGLWSGWSPTWMLGHRIYGKALGIIGMGRIGQAVARRARAFGLEIHYHNRNRVNKVIEQALEATWHDSLDHMLPRVDILSVNCPHTPATWHLLSARRLNLMRADSYIINTARGEVIDEKALADVLEARGIAGAGLDVLEHEPAVNPRLLALDNVIVLPHMGSATLESRTEMGEAVIVNIRTFVDGHKPPNRVLPEIR